MFTQINPIALSGMTLAVHNSYNGEAYELIAVATPEALHIEALAVEYKRLLDLESSIIKRATAYVSTSSMKMQDQKRDNILGVIMQIINAHLTSIIEEKKNAAMWLDAKVAPYRNIRNHDYRTQTREINGLIAVLTTDEAMAHVNTLGISQELEVLAQTNALMDQALDEKLMEEVNRTPQTDINTNELRSQIDDVYGQIVQTVNAYAVVQTTPEIETFITQMNALITLTKRTMASLGKTSEEEEPETDNTTGTTDTADSPNSTETDTESAT